jgi:hypothetical protein
MQSLAPEFALTAARLPIACAHVDCNSNWDACESNGVVAYPTVILFSKQGDRSVEYNPGNGDFSASGMSAFVEKHLKGSKASESDVPSAFCATSLKWLRPGAGWYHNVSESSSQLCLFFVYKKKEYN